VTGRVVPPGDPDWDEARQAFDVLADLQPEAVAFPIDEADVVAVVNYAREQGLQIAPQATGHNAVPLGALDAGYHPNFVEHPADASAFFDPDTWTRLRELKTLYDPDDLFRANHHIPPLS
jgi:FAD/FMN-containing dehydrogenase